MAKVHILEMAELKNSLAVVYHIAVPDENNAANVALSEAMQGYLTRDGGTITSCVPGLETDYAAEYAQIQAGEVYEHRKTIDLDAKWTNAQKASAVDSDYLASVARVQDRIRNTLTFWGGVRNPA